MFIDKSTNSAYYSGLTTNEVERSRQLHGRNILTPAKRKTWWKLYLEKYEDPIIRILIVAAVISLILAFFGGSAIETIGIIIAIFFATTIGFAFEIDASRKFNVLTSFNENTSVKVRRNGKVMLIPRQDIVVGDIVMLEIGDEVPADGKLLEAIGLCINESCLTGELLAEKTTDINAITEENTYPVDRIYRSTMVMDGRGVMRVTEVGDATEIGRVAHKSMEITDVETPLNHQLNRLARQISIIGSIISALVFVFFIIQDYHIHNAWAGYSVLHFVQTFLKYFMVAVTLIVMAVPEGLPMAVTLSLALNMRRMLKSNNLVRKLHACETMGAVTVICTDKTGTLTQNRMIVHDVKQPANTDEEKLAYAIATNTTAEIDERGDGIGNPTEVALLAWLKDEMDHDYRDLRKKTTILHQLPFSSERKYMQTIAEINGKCYNFIKGAPEIILSMTDNDEQQKHYSELLLRWQKQAMRTLAIAYCTCDKNQTTTAENKSKDFILQAVVAICDPIRQDVPSAVEECRKAGIEIKIVTGDTSATALEIARQIGIYDIENEKTCIDGAEFASLSDEEALEIIKELRVLSRARPTDKQRLVELLQRHGEIVAVTGDGTNDAPALNHAHVGLSLGSGTAVAKEASDMTLLDDSFSSIVKAVMWGRSLYRNIQRFLYFQLIVNVVALLLCLFGTLAGNELPLTVTQILWINLIMDTMASLALSSLPPSHEVMREKPRKQTDSIITKNMITGIMITGVSMFVVLFALLYHFESNGDINIHELTIFFTIFVMMQFWNLLNAKTLHSTSSTFHNLSNNKGLIFVLIVIFLCQWLIVTFGGSVFRTEPLSLVEWLCIVGGTAIVMVIGEIHQLTKRMYKRV